MDLETLRGWKKAIEAKVQITPEWQEVLTVLDKLIEYERIGKKHLSVEELTKLECLADEKRNACKSDIPGIHTELSHIWERVSKHCEFRRQERTIVPVVGTMLVTTIVALTTVLAYELSEINKELKQKKADAEKKQNAPSTKIDTLEEASEKLETQAKQNARGN